MLISLLVNSYLIWFSIIIAAAFFSLFTLYSQHGIHFLCYKTVFSSLCSLFSSMTMILLLLFSILILFLFLPESAFNFLIFIVINCFHYQFSGSVFALKEQSPFSIICSQLIVVFSMFSIIIFTNNFKFTVKITHFRNIKLRIETFAGSIFILNSLREISILDSPFSTIIANLS